MLGDSGGREPKLITKIHIPPILLILPIFIPGATHVVKRDDISKTIMETLIPTFYLIDLHWQVYDRFNVRPKRMIGIIVDQCLNAVTYRCSWTE